MTPAEAKAAGWCLTPSSKRLHEIYTRARAATPAKGGIHTVAERMRFFRVVSAEFHRRLKRARIYVEGA